MALPRQISTGPDLLPRVNGRRNRHRPSNLRGEDGEDGVFYYDAVVTERRASRDPPTDAPKGRIAAYCTCDQIALFKLLKWLDRPSKEGAVLTESVAGNARWLATGWTNKMYMGVVHSTLRVDGGGESGFDGTGRGETQQKDAFYFAYVHGVCCGEVVERANAASAFCDEQEWVLRVLGNDARRGDDASAGAGAVLDGTSRADRSRRYAVLLRGHESCGER